MQTTPETFLIESCSQIPALGFRERFVRREILLQVLRSKTALLTPDPDVVFGINSFVKKRFSNETFDLLPILSFTATLSRITAGANFYKSRSFNYISESEDLAEVLRLAAENACFLTSIFGVDFFSRRDGFSGERKTFFKAQIGETDFYLSAKGGSGAGTFSVDYAIGVLKDGNRENNKGELWRTGFDTEMLCGTGRNLRIIRTGNGVRYDPYKTLKFEEFKNYFKSTPARFLTSLISRSAHFLNAAEVIALTTEGAKVLSSLPKRANAYNYSRLFTQMGFEEDQRRFWMKYTDPGSHTGLSRREKRNFEVVADAFCNLKSLRGEEFPLKLAA